MKEFTITKQELATYPYLSNDRHLILSLLKDKGAPIVGVIALKVDPDYVVSECFVDPITEDQVYRFKEVVGE